MVTLRRMQRQGSLKLGLLIAHKDRQKKMEVKSLNSKMLRCRRMTVISYKCR